MGTSGVAIKAKGRTRKRLDRLLKRIGAISFSVVLACSSLPTQPFAITSAAAQEGTQTDEIIVKTGDSQLEDVAPPETDEESIATPNTPANDTGSGSPQEDSRESRSDDEFFEEPVTQDAPELLDGLDSAIIIEAIAADDELADTAPDTGATPTLQVLEAADGSVAVDVAHAPSGATLVVELAHGVGADSFALAAALPSVNAGVSDTTDTVVGIHPYISYAIPGDGTYIFTGAHFGAYKGAHLLDTAGTTLATAVAEPQEFASLSFLSANPGEQKYLETGAEVWYAGYLTYHFWVEGHSGQCANPNRPQPASGTYTVVDPGSVGAVTEFWYAVRNIMYYGYGGPGFEWAKANGVWPSTWYDGSPMNDERLYVLQHILIAENVYNDFAASTYGCDPAFISWYENNVGDFNHAISDWNRNPYATGPILYKSDYAGIQIEQAPEAYEVYMLYTSDYTQNIIVGGDYVPTEVTLQIEKSSSDVSYTASVAGAVYEVYDENGSVVATLTTDGSGKTERVTLQAGTYTCREVKAPAGYQLDTNIYTLDLTSVGTDYTIPHTDEPDTITIELVKESALSSISANNGCYSLEGAVYEVRNEAGQVVGTITTNASGKGSLPGLPLGMYSLIEVQAPIGFALDATPHGIKATQPGSITVTVSDAPMYDPLPVSLAKFDTRHKAAQGNANLAGALIAVRYYDGYFTLEDLPVSATREWIIQTDAQGHATLDNQHFVSGDALFTVDERVVVPLGTIAIQEVQAPEGYLINDEIQLVQIANESLEQLIEVPMEFELAEDVMCGGIRVIKYDREVDTNVALGGASLENATFEVINSSASSVIVEDKTIAPGSVVLELVTNADGEAQTDIVLPYGSYAIRESAAPRGYLRDTASVQVRIEHNGVIVDAVEAGATVRDQVVRGDLAFVKVDEDSMARMARIPFMITSKTTGEHHIVVTDENGRVDTSATWNPHTTTTNANDLAYSTTGEALTSGTSLGYRIDESTLHQEAGLWFTGAAGLNSAPDDALGALPFDTYTIEELRCSANEGHRLVSFEAVVTRNGATLDLGTVDNHRAPAIGTEFVGPDGAHEVTANSQVELVDHVGYTNLEPGEYTLTLELVYADDATSVLDSSGTPITSTIDFRAISSSGSVDVPIVVDLSACAHQRIVAFETLTRASTIIATHKDPSDSWQTITVVEKPQIKTTLRDSLTHTQTPVAAPVVTLIDTIAYEGLVPGHTYTAIGTLHYKDSGEVFTDKEGPVVARTQFVPESSSGEVEVVFKVTATSLAGTRLVAFEQLMEDDREIAVHADINDEEQTVEFPSIATSLTDDAGSKTIPPFEEVDLIDVVECSGLVVGSRCELKGVLYDQSTKEPLYLNGHEVTSRISFTATAPVMEVEMPFTIDARSIAGKRIVAFEDLLFDGIVIARHADLEAPSQTIDIEELPQLATTLTNEQGSHQITATAAVDLIDTVSITGLIPGVTYELEGVLVEKSTGSQLRISDGSLVYAQQRFDATGSDMTIEMPFSVDPIALGVAGHQVVAFETLTRVLPNNDTVEVAKHVDLSDASQTVAFGIPFIHTVLTGPNGAKRLDVTGEVRLVDTVQYEGLEPGVSYTMTGTLVDRDTGAPLTARDVGTIESSTTFVAQDTHGIVELPFEVDTSLLAGKHIVAFERIATTQKNALIAEHADLNDIDQTVEIAPRIGTTLIDDASQSHTVMISSQAKLIDTVSYEGLVPGEHYVMVGRLVDTHEQTIIDAQGNEAVSRIEFVAHDRVGSIEVPFELDLSAAHDADVLVAFESLFDNTGTQIATHADINDVSQSVVIATPPTPVEHTTPRTGDSTIPTLPIALAGIALMGAGTIAIRSHSRRY